MDGFQRIASTAERLKEAMRIAGKTQADLVRETGIGKSNISRYITGRFEPKNDAVHKMAAALNVSEMWLWGCDVPMERAKMEEIKQKNDALADIVIRLRTDSIFMEAVETLYEMDSAKLTSLLALLK